MTAPTSPPVSLPYGQLPSWAVVLTALATQATPGPAQQPVLPESPKFTLTPTQVSKLIAQLEHPQFKVRDEATQALLHAGWPVQQALRRALEDKTNSLEKQRRLQRLVDGILGFRLLEPFDGIHQDASQQLAYYDRLMVIDNEWDLARLRRVAPGVPAVDLRKRHLLLAISWNTLPRTFLPPIMDGATLVVRVKQATPPLVASIDYTPPKFIVAEVTALAGPVRFEVNGKPEFTVWRGPKLQEQAARQWQEIMKWHDYRLKLAPDLPQQERGKRLLETHHQRTRNLEIEIRRLAEMRAWPAIPDLFHLAERFGEYAPPIGPVRNALVALGGPEVVSGCFQGILSKNPHVRRLAILVAYDLHMQELRPVFHSGLTLMDEGSRSFSVEGLKKLGPAKTDVPVLIAIVNQFHTPDDGKFAVYQTATFVLGELGAAAAPALPVLDQFMKHPVNLYREPARRCAELIRAALKAKLPQGGKAKNEKTDRHGC